MPRPTTPGTTKPYPGITIWTAQALALTLDHTLCGGLTQAITEHAQQVINDAARQVDTRLEYDGNHLRIHNEWGKDPIPRRTVQTAIDTATRTVEHDAGQAVAEHMRGACSTCNPPMMH